jgi:serine/threonine protein kinase
MAVQLLCPNPRCGAVLSASDAELASLTHCPRCGKDLPRSDGSATGLTAGSSFGRYQIVRTLGQGGMGAVYLAQDTQLDRRVALKIPHLPPGSGPEVLERFYREARAAAALNHPNLCPIYDVGQVDGAPYLTMAYIEGRPLSELIGHDKPLPQRQAAAVIRKLARALQEAHARGVVHRDLKPANVLVNPKRDVVIVDFGLARRDGGVDARLTKSGMILGTPAYMSPEQVAGDSAAVGPGCDIYSLGVILYELLTGQLPFEGSAALVLGQIMVAEPEPLSRLRADVDPRLESICLKAMSKRVSERYATMRDFGTALSEYLRGAEDTPALSPADAPVPASLRATEVPPTTGGGSLVGRFFDKLAARRTLAPREFVELPDALPLATTQAGASTEVPRRPFHRWVAVASAASAALVCLLGVIIYVVTDDGTVKIELSDPQASAVVKVDGKSITVEGLGEPLRLRVGQHQLEVASDGFEARGESFTVKRGENRVIHVELVPKVKEVGERSPLVEDMASGIVSSSFFNGMNLSGWEGLKGYWQVRDGAIVGSCPPGQPAHTFLCSRGTYRDFELRFKVRLLDGVGNSGVQFRSLITDEDGFRAQGPQCEIVEPSQHYPPGSLVTEPAGEPAIVAPRGPVAKVYKMDDFNEFSIRCVGKHVTIRVNGLTTVDGDFPTMPDEGIIAWQIHGGNTPREVAFKDITLLDLTSPDEGRGWVQLFNGNDLTRWFVDSGVGNTWRVEDGDLVVNGTGDYRKLGWLLSDRRFSDFILRFEFQLSKGANSGVALRAESGDRVGSLPVHPEVSLLDTDNELEQTGTFQWSNSLRIQDWLPFDRPSNLNPAGSWNEMEIEQRGSTLRVAINDREVLKTDLGKLANNPQALPGLNRRSGRIGFQAHTGTVRFRRVRIRELSSR